MAVGRHLVAARSRRLVWAIPLAGLVAGVPVALDQNHSLISRQGLKAMRRPIG
jgi:hypothetical protein